MNKISKTLSDISYAAGLLFIAIVIACTGGASLTFLLFLIARGDLRQEEMRIFAVTTTVAIFIVFAVLVAISDRKISNIVTPMILFLKKIIGIPIVLFALATCWWRDGRKNKTKKRKNVFFSFFKMVMEVIFSYVLAIVALLLILIIRLCIWVASPIFWLIKRKEDK